jgi:chemotaxis protein CheD
MTDNVTRHTRFGLNNMNTATASNPTKEILVGMGQIAAGQAPQRMKAILGSCIGLALYHPGRKTGVMAHVVLPESAGRDGSPGKFADTAVPQMLAVLRERNLPTCGLSAKLAGGANMFNGSGPLQIGNANAAAVVVALKKAGIPVIGQDVGGTHGRRVDFDCSSGVMIVHCAGHPSRTL